MESFKEIAPGDLQANPFSLIGSDWMLISAGDTEKFNTMTASWGGLGILWNKPVATIYVRPQRYTHEFTSKNDFFTLTFFEEKHREILKFCGANSGRKVNKVKETGLLPIDTPHGSVAFSQARLIMECRKLYTGELSAASFNVPEIARRNYPAEDYHTFYIGEIISCLQKE